MAGDAARGKPMHVLHYAWAISEGGAANGIVNLCNGLDPARYRSSIISMTYLGGHDLRLDPDRTTVHRMYNKPGKDPAQMLRLARKFRELKPDILHTHAWGTLFEGLVAAWLARVPAVVHGEHGTMEERPSRRRIQRWLWGRVDQVLAVSESLRRSLAETVGFPGEKIAVVPNGVDTERFRPRPECRARVRSELGAGDADLVLGAVGRLHPIKGHGHLIRAMASLPERVKLWLVGDGEQRSEYEELIAGLGLGARVRLLGHRNDAHEILSAFDVMCQPSLNEGMSNTILEAMATRVPVVATAVGGNPELVDDGRTGLLVDSGRDDAFVPAITTLLERPDARQRLGEAGLRLVHETYSIPRMVRGYAEIYERVCGAKRRHA